MKINRTNNSNTSNKSNGYERNSNPVNKTNRRAIENSKVSNFHHDDKNVTTTQNKNQKSDRTLQSTQRLQQGNLRTTFQQNNTNIRNKVGYDKQEQIALHGKQFNVTCIRLDDEGRGLVSINQRLIAIPNLLPSEEATVEVSVHRGRIDGKVIALLSQHEDRIKSKCPVFDKCGGCQFHHLRYDKQVAWKESYIDQQFKDLRLKNITRYPMALNDHPLHYRHKNQMVFGMGKKNQVVSGFFEEDSHRIINFDHCLIQHQKANEIAATFKQLMTKHKVMPYDEDTKEGLIRHLFIRYGYATKEILVAIVTASEVFPARKNLLTDFRQLHPEITTIVQNINSRQTNMVLGEKQRVLYGKGYIEDVLGGVRFQISASSFYQVNPEQTEVLYQAAIRAANLQSHEVVLDAYSGIGTIGLIASSKVKQVISVELNRQAFQDAIQNAKINGIKNVTFINDDASQCMMKLAENKETIDVVLLDPPRSGSDERFVNALEVLRPKKIVYVSCNVDTQVRDIKRMMRFGYQVKSIQGFDLFPYTKHIESVVLMCASSKAGKC